MADSRSSQHNTRDAYRNLWKTSLLKVKALLSDQIYPQPNENQPKSQALDHSVTWRAGNSVFNTLQQQDDWRRKRIKLVTQLLDEYDQEATEEKYRSLNKVTYAVKPAWYSVSCEMAGDKVKKRLLELIGTDEVSINDRDFMLRLQEKIAEEHQKQEELKLKQLQEEEKKRERKLILEGKVERKSNKEKEKKENAANEEDDSNEYISFEDRRPNHNSYNLREKMKHEMENQECEGEEAAKAEEEGTEGGEENEDEATPVADDDGEQAAVETTNEDSEAAKMETSHLCSFLNRPYSARLEELIKEETYQGMLDIAIQLVAAGEKK